MKRCGIANNVLQCSIWSVQDSGEKILPKINFYQKDLICTKICGIVQTVEYKSKGYQKDITAFVEKERIQVLISFFFKSKFLIVFSKTEYSAWKMIEPHSCGGRCGRKLNCGHNCKINCHSKACPTCIEIVEKICECGKESKKIECSSNLKSIPFQCGQVKFLIFF